VNEGRIVGSIRPAEEDGAPPVFAILRRERNDFAYLHQTEEEIAPCKHDTGTFVLNEKWSTISCSVCKEKLDPFCVLMRHAEWGERLESQRKEIVQAERNRWTEELRRLRTLRGITPEESRALLDVIQSAYSKAPGDLKSLARQTERALSQRRMNRPRRARPA
jgi:hypothetical protein